MPANPNVSKAVATVLIREIPLAKIQQFVQRAGRGLPNANGQGCGGGCGGGCAAAIDRAGESGLTSQQIKAAFKDSRALLRSVSSEVKKTRF